MISINKKIVGVIICLILTALAYYNFEKLYPLQNKEIKSESLNKSDASKLSSFYSGEAFRVASLDEDDIFRLAKDALIAHVDATKKIDIKNYTLPNIPTTSVFVTLYRNYPRRFCGL